MKKLLGLLIPTLIVGIAIAAGRIQNEDVKSLSDIESSAATITGNISSTSECITSPSSTTNIAVGQYIYDTTTSAHITSGTTVAGLPGTCSSGQIQMSADAAATATGDTLTFGGQASQLINTTKMWDTTYVGQLSALLSGSGLANVGSASNGQVLSANGSGGATWSTLTPSFTGFTQYAPIYAATTTTIGSTTSAGTSGQTLISQGSAAPAYQWGGGVITSQSSTYSVPSTGYTVLLSGASFTVTLPDATAAANTHGTITLRHEGTSLTDVYTIDTTSSQTVCGQSSGGYAEYTNGETLTIFSDGSNWQCLSHISATSPTNSGAISLSSTSAYAFTITSSSATAGWQYTNNGHTYTLSATIVSATTADMSGTGSPSASGTLTCVVSSGCSANITFSAVTTTAPSVGTNTTNQVVWYRQGPNAVITYTVVQTAAGSEGIGDYIFYFPSGLVASTTNITPYVLSVGSYLGSVVAAGSSYIPTVGPMTNSGSATVGTSQAYLYSTTSFRVSSLVDSDGSFSTGAVGSGFLALDTASTAYAITITIPMSGWQP